MRLAISTCLVHILRLANDAPVINHWVAAAVARTAVNVVVAVLITR